MKLKITKKRDLVAKIEALMSENHELAKELVKVGREKYALEEQVLKLRMEAKQRGE